LFGFTIAVALGLLSKASFVIVGASATLAFLIGGLRLNIGRGDLAKLIAAGALGVVFALPWWVFDWRDARDYAAYAMGFVRHAQPWLPALARDLLGVPLAVFLAVALVGATLQLARRQLSLSRPALLMIAVAAAAALPLTIVHAVGANHNMRLLSPALIPAGLAVALFIDGAEAFHGLLFSGAMAFMITAQSVAFSRTLAAARPDQWQWEGLHELAMPCRIANPVVAYIGSGSSMTPPHIEMPWVRRHEPVESRWLWRYERGPVDWATVFANVAQSDMVVTILNYRGDADDKQDLDNAHNQEFFNRMRMNAGFRGPVELRVDPINGRKVQVFMRASCEPAAIAGAAR
jgi:hypothetical protein